jgi:hypothetical protein
MFCQVLSVWLQVIESGMTVCHILGWIDVIKKDDDFDISQFEKMLINIKAQITPQFLQKKP